MADGIQLNSGTGGDVLAADDVGGYKYQIGKMAFGVDGAVTLVSSSNPLPCTSTITGSVAVTGTFWQATQPISAAALPLPSGAATEATLVTLGVLTTLLSTEVTTALVGTNIGATSETAAATDTSTSGLNGLFKRLLQRITTLFTLLPAALTGSGNFKVALQEAIPAGTNGIGKLTANAGVTIGAVEIAAAQTLATVTTVSTVSSVTAVADITKFGGQAINLGNGVAANTIRVTLASDSTGVLAGVTTVTTLSQFGGQAINLGNGAVGTGTLRVTMANDSTGILAGVTTVTTLTGSGIAHDGVDSGNPHKIGARAVASVSAQTLVAANDRSDVFVGTDGVLIFRLHAPLGDQAHAHATTTGTSDTATGIGLPGASTYWRITQMLVSNKSSTSTEITIKNGSGGATLAVIPVPAGGCTITFQTPILVTTVNTEPYFAAADAVSTLRVTTFAFKSKL